MSCPLFCQTYVNYKRSFCQILGNLHVSDCQKFGKTPKIDQTQDVLPSLWQELPNLMASDIMAY
jgi:hypothetical protein